MAFGQASGSPATHSQLRELTELLQAAGHSDFRDARGPMGFTQRQAGGKFTRDEADEFIAALQQAAHESAEPDPAPTQQSARPKRTQPKPVQRAATKSPVASPVPSPVPSALASPLASPLAAFSDEQLAAELQERGWVVMEP